MNQIADYEIVQSTGPQGSEKVLLAKPPTRLGLTDPLVSLRVIRHPSSEADFESLVAHIRRYAAASSTNLVEIHEVGRQGELLFLTSSHVEGGSLGAPQTPLSRIDVLRAVGRAANGAHQLHQAGLAHQAIMPESVLLAADGAKLGRLGLTQALSPGMTIAQQSRSTGLEYLSPELIQGHPPSRASDVWALAATLHRALTGQPLHPGMPPEPPLTALRYLLNNRPTLSDALRNGELKIIESATSLDPTERPLTAADLASEILAEADRQAKQATG